MVNLVKLTESSKLGLVNLVNLVNLGVNLVNLEKASKVNLVVNLINLEKASKVNLAGKSAKSGSFVKAVLEVNLGCDKGKSGKSLLIDDSALHKSPFGPLPCGMGNGTACRALLRVN